MTRVITAVNTSETNGGGGTESVLVAIDDSVLPLGC